MFHLLSPANSLLWDILKHMIWEKERVGGVERVSLTSIHDHVCSRQLAGSCRITQGARLSALWWPGGGWGWEGGSSRGRCMHTTLQSNYPPVKNKALKQRTKHSVWGVGVCLHHVWEVFSSESWFQAEMLVPGIPTTNGTIGPRRGMARASCTAGVTKEIIFWCLSVEAKRR